MTFRSVAVIGVLLACLDVIERPAVGQETEHPIVTQVKPQLKDPTKPFTIFVNLQVKDGMGPKLEAAFAKAAKETRKEKGNKAYDLSRSAKAPNTYVVYERWQDLAALRAHLSMMHVTALLTEAAELLAGPPDVTVFLPVAE